jgi:F0F1-type ATP synthase membrane subunit b/b'
MATVAPNTPSSPTPQGGPGVATNVPESRRRSGAFTNLQSYLRANRGTTEEAANRVASEIEERGQQALQDIDAERSRAEAQVQQTGPQVQEADIQSQIQQIAPSVNQTTALTGPQADETGLQQTQQTISQLREATPSQVQFDFSDAASRARAAERDARMLGTTEGIQTLLGQDGPGQTQGERRLDTLLLQSIPGARGRFADVQQSLIGATDPAVDQATAGVQSAIDQRQARLEALRQYADQQLASEIEQAYGLLEQQRPELAQQVQDRAAQLGNQYDTTMNAYLRNVVPSENFTGIFGQVDPRAFVTGAGRKTADQLLLEAAGNPLARVQNLTTNQLLDPESAARLNALYGLRGDLGQAGEDFQIQQYTPDQVNVDDLMFQGQLPNINSRLQAEATGATAAFNDRFGSAVQSYQAASPNEAAANEALDKLTSGDPNHRSMRSSQWAALTGKMNALEQSLPQINQALQSFGFNSLGNNLTEALRKFGYTGPARNSASEYINLNDPDFKQGRISFGASSVAGDHNPNMVNLARALKRMDDALGTQAQTNNLPDIYVPPPPAPVGSEPAGTPIDDIPGFGVGRILTSG